MREILGISRAIYPILERSAIRSLVQKGALLNQALTWFNNFVTRVLADSGTIEDSDDTKSIFQHLKDNDTYDDTLLLFDANAGLKIRADGLNDYVSDVYDLADDVMAVENMLRGNYGGSDNAGSLLYMDVDSPENEPALSLPP